MEHDANHKEGKDDHDGRDTLLEELSAAQVSTATKPGIRELS